MATNGDIQARVLRRVIDAPPSVVAEIQDLVNDAIREAEDRTDFPWMSSQIAYTTIVNQRTLGAVPGDWKKWREKPYYTEFTDGKARGLIIPPNDAAASMAISADRTDRPYYLTRSDLVAATGSSDFNVYPLPNGLSDYADGEYRVTIPYWRYLPDLSANSDTNAATVDRELVQFIIQWASKLAFELDWNSMGAGGGGQAEYWERLAEKSWLRIKRREGTNVLSGVNTLVPHMGADDPHIAE